MRYYTVSQWLIFFFIYCFLGWVWECCYVSVRKRKWVNRGFLHGPFLPIYGSGAIVILISTIAVKDIVPLVFLFGMVSSTILEFCTGCCMEKLFGVRYWDYSNLPLNFKGHICFFISLAWGAFSILLVCVIHKPIEAVVLMIPKTIADIIAVDTNLIPVLMSAGMHCVGCPSAQGESLEEACFVHGLDADEVEAALNDYLAQNAE